MFDLNNSVTSPQLTPYSGVPHGISSHCLWRLGDVFVLLPCCLCVCLCGCGNAVASEPFAEDVFTVSVFQLVWHLRPKEGCSLINMAFLTGKRMY